LLSGYLYNIKAKGVTIVTEIGFTFEGDCHGGIPESGDDHIVLKR
jgi:hypothetical protein